MVYAVGGIFLRKTAWGVVPACEFYQEGGSLSPLSVGLPARELTGAWGHIHSCNCESKKKGGLLRKLHEFSKRNSRLCCDLSRKKKKGGRRVETSGQGGRSSCQGFGGCSALKKKRDFLLQGVADTGKGCGSRYKTSLSQ